MDPRGSFYHRGTSTRQPCSVNSWVNVTNPRPSAPLEHDSCALDGPCHQRQRVQAVHAHLRPRRRHSPTSKTGGAIEAKVMGRKRRKRQQKREAGCWQLLRQPHPSEAAQASRVRGTIPLDPPPRPSNRTPPLLSHHQLGEPLACRSRPPLRAPWPPPGGRQGPGGRGAVRVVRCTAARPRRPAPDADGLPCEAHHIPDKFIENHQESWRLLMQLVTVTCKLTNTPTRVPLDKPSAKAETSHTRTPSDNLMSIYPLL